MPSSEQGINIDRYTVIPRVLIFLTRGDNVLLLKGNPDKKLWADQYNGIGGHVEPGEDILSAAYRELMEETGIVPNYSIEKKTYDLSLQMCGNIVIDTNKNPGICIFIFTGEYVSGEPKFCNEGSLHWIPYKNLANIPVVEDVPVLVDKIRSKQTGDAPFSGKGFYQKNKLELEFLS